MNRLRTEEIKMLALWAVLILLEVKATVRRCGRVYLLLRRYFGVGSGSDAVFTDIHSGLAGSCCFKLIWFEMVKPICGPPPSSPQVVLETSRGLHSASAAA